MNISAKRDQLSDKILKFRLVKFLLQFFRTFWITTFKFHLVFKFHFLKLLDFCPLKTEEIDKNQTLEFKKNVKKSRVEVDRNSETLEPNCFLRKFWKLLAYNVNQLIAVAD